MKIKLIAIVIVILLTGASFAETLKEFGDRVSYFYKQPTKKAFIELQRSADTLSHELSGTGNGADLLIAVMVARISQKHNWPISETVYAEKANEIVKGESDFAKFVNDDSSVNPSKLDIWWASFFATGEEKYIDNIYEYAGLELPKSDMNKMLIIGSATWSFKANCRQHERILAYAKVKAKSESGAKLKYLQESIAYAEKESIE